MSNRSNELSRRKFIQHAAAVAVMPSWAASGAARAWRPNQERHRILCCNIRVDLPEDMQKGFGWAQRKDVCVQVIANQQPDIICLQEVLKGQMEDLKQAFPAFQAFGFDGPEMDARPTGYHGIAKNPIMFSRERYELVSAGCYWLSETPLIAGSISWESARARHANWIRLEDKQTKQQFRVVNLHLDHVSQAAKEGQVNLVMEESAQYAADFPQLLTGDFNANMEHAAYRLVKDAGWQDTYTAIHGPDEPGHTGHQFQGEHYVNKDKARKIDFIFSKGSVSALSAAIIRDQVEGKYPSDHYFVSADVQID